MTKTKKTQNTSNTKKETHELCVHFDTEEHRITLDEFITTVSSYQIIANNLAENIFNTKKGVKIYILPPKSGSFDLSMLLSITEKLSDAIIAGMAVSAVSNFIQGLTKPLNLKDYPDGFQFGKAVRLLGESITCLMQKTSIEIQELERLIPEGKNIDASIKAKADFYNMCSKNKDIKGIGFTHEHKFELKRADFVSRGVPPAVKPLPVKVELKELIIVKPVNVEEDLQWDLKDKNTNEPLTAKMLDEDFKTMLFNGKCPQRKHTTPDVITAMVEFHDNLKDGKESKSEYLITDVYKFNRKILKDIPKGYKLNRRKKVTENNNGQLKLKLFNEQSKK